MQVSSPTNKTVTDYFDSWTLAKGKAYFTLGMVREFSLDSETELVGSVSGSAGKIYISRIYFDKKMSRIKGSDCSCPMFGDCKHTVALALAYFNGVQAAASFKPAHSPSTGKHSAGSRQLKQAGGLHLVSNGQNRQALPAPLPAVPAAPKDIQDTLRLAAAQYQRLKSVFLPAGQANSQQREGYKARSALVYVLKSESWSTRPEIELVRVKLRKDGSYGAENPLSLDAFERNPPAYALPEDFDIVDLWQTITDSGSYWSYSNGEFKDPQLLAVLLSRIIETNRCFFDSAQNPPLGLGPPLPGHFVWEETSEHTTRLAVRASNGDEQYCCLRWKIPWYVDRQTWRCGPVKLALSSEIVETLLAMRPVNEGEAGALPALLAELGLHELIPPPPSQKKVIVKAVKPSPFLRVEDLKSTTPLFNCGSVTTAGQVVKTAILASHFKHPDNWTYLDAEEQIVIEKHDQSAQGYDERLKALGFKEVSAGSLVGASANERYFIAADVNSWLNFGATALDELRALGWVIPNEVDSSLRPTELDESVFNFNVEDDGDWWFSLSLNIEIEGRSIPLLPILVSAIRALPLESDFRRAVEKLNRNGRFLTMLPEGKIISLPYERIKSILEALQELIKPGSNLTDVKLSVLHAAQLLEGEEWQKARWIGADRILSLVERLRKLGSIERAPVPKALRAELRPYQRDGLDWLQFLAKQGFGGILADDMGLGKTVQLIAHICLEKQSRRLKSPFLVVCPTSVLPNWLSEFEKFSPALNVAAFSGAERHANLDLCKSADVVVTTYPLIVRDIIYLQKIEWHGIGLDEAQAIKNSSTQIAQAVRRLSAKHRFCLTGTPIENHLGELWAQFNFLMPGLLGDNATFGRHIRTPIEKEGNLALKSALANRIRPFVLRRTKQEVAANLPEKTAITQLVELEGGQRELYEAVRLASTKQVRDEIANKGFKQSQIVILDALLKLRQACCDPRLVKLAAAGKARESAKLFQLKQMLQELTEEGRRIIVFSQFTSMLDLIADELRREGLSFVELRGDTRDRKTPVEQFQSGAVPIFLISLKAGGTGLNLTAADVVIHYDPWWNPAVEDQATDRAHRIGQTKNVFVYKLIARGTIEQRMLELQERKRIIASSIYDQSGNLSPSFSEADLAALLQPIQSIGSG